MWWHRALRRGADACCAPGRRRRCTAAPPARIEIPFSSGTALEISSGRFARMADGCAVARLGDTAVMATVVGRPRAAPAASFAPLTVDYRQKAAAAGRIPTNFLRREMAPSERETLTARQIDRSLRPLFPPGFNVETQVVCNVLAVDGAHEPDVASINAASAALCLSDVPWAGPVGAVRVGLAGSELLVNPTRRQQGESPLSLLVAAAQHNLLVMLEGGANDLPLPTLQHALRVGVREAQAVVRALERLRKSHGRPKRPLDAPPTPSETLLEGVRALSEMRLRQVLRDATLDKMARDEAVTLLRHDVLDKMATEHDSSLVIDAFNKCFKDIFRDLIFEDDKRCDGRGLKELRPISSQVDLYKPLHGSALFQRGQTQVMCTVALDSPDAALRLDPVSVLTGGVKEKNFFLHYEFPPYATREIGRAGGGAGRREVGHGALAEKGLRPVVPNDLGFTVRLSAEVLESNGSSSMASVCGGSLALMDAGVPLAAAAAGVAVGLVTRYDDQDTKHIHDYRILTDILGIEDYLGDMDFKVAGTKKGITALQLDVKVPGLPLKIVMEALQHASEAKAKIIDLMDETLSAPRRHKENWPVVERLEVPPQKRARLLGVGGANLKRILAQTGVQVSALEDDVFEMFAPNRAALHEAKELIEQQLQAPREPTLDFGAVYTARVVEVRDAGVMVTLYPGMQPTLLHNSQLSQRKVSHPSVLGLTEGSELQVKFFGRDPVSGVIRLSRKVLEGPASAVIRDLGAPKA